MSLREKAEVCMTNSYKQAMSIAMVLLSGVSNPTRDDIRQKVDLAIQTVKTAGNVEEIDLEQLLRDIESNITVTTGAGSILEDKTNHYEWLSPQKADIKWKLWKRYQRYLETVRLMPQSTTERLDTITDDILERLEDPKREAPWDTRGMVVGRVQSGKTTNYIGLICKAVDAGYKVVIILTGIHNSLRSQTQLRIDEGVLGYDTQVLRNITNHSKKIGVGLLPEQDQVFIQSLTSSATNGDFNRGVAQQVGGNFGGDPFILVIKKNARILENIKQWALSVRSEIDPVTNKPVIKNIPLLIIDDEADNASVNTRMIPTDEKGMPLPEYEVTAINKKIRELLMLFNKSAYIGYTATPFANIFIPYDAKTESLDDDIFPRNFILNLPTPSNYIGPSEIFGISDGQDQDDNPLGLIRDVEDHENSFPPKHKKDFVPPYLPDTLIKAIHSFILVCAARHAVGQSKEHNSMLIHVTRYIDVQETVTTLVTRELNSIRKRLEYGDGNSQKQIINTLKELWNTDFIPSTEKMQQMEKSKNVNLLDISWEKLEQSLFPAVSKIKVKTLNNSVKDVLDYELHKDTGLSVVAIGGDKLSRGLTLEGLSVSYYIRTSRTYDTLMQMGRWFGYRPGYLNLCRLYTTPQLNDWYRFVTYASEELLEEFNRMAQNGETSRQYGLKVRAHPEGMLITAMSKMRSGKRRQFGYGGEIAESAYFPTDNGVYENNKIVTEQFLSSMPAPEQSSNYIWRDIAGELVADYISNFKTSPLAIKANSKNLAAYINKQISNNELIKWTVVLLSVNQAGSKKTNVRGLKVGKSIRSAKLYNLGDVEAYMLNQRRLISQSHEYLDFTEEMIAEAKKIATDKNGKEPTPEAVRKTRTPQNGLLLIYYLDLNLSGDKKVKDNLIPTVGFAVSFPYSDTADRAQFVVNPVEAERYEDDE